MSTVVSTTLNAASPSCRLAITANVKDFWDSTNKRFKSGLVKTSITALSISGTLGSGEKVHFTLQPAVHNPARNGKAEYNPTATGSVSGFSTFTHNTAVNYGNLDPSAAPEPDGSITLAVVDVSLPSGDLSGSTLTATVTYTKTFTELSPYSVMSGPQTVSVSAGTPSVAPWSLQGWETGDFSGEDYFRVQFQSLATTCRGVGHFTATAGAMNLSVPVPYGDARVLSLADSYQHVFAVNNSELDSSCPLVNDQAAGTTIYNFLNCGLEGGKGTATLSYATEHSTV